MLCSNDIYSGLESLACPVDYRCGRDKIFDVTDEWTQIRTDAARYGLTKGEECSYQLEVSGYEEDEMIEVDIVSIQNTNL